MAVANGVLCSHACDGAGGKKQTGDARAMHRHTFANHGRAEGGRGPPSAAVPSTADECNDPPATSVRRPALIHVLLAVRSSIQVRPTSMPTSRRCASPPTSVLESPVTRRGRFGIGGDSSTGEVIGGERLLRVGIAFARTAIFAMSRLLAREEILRLKHDPLKVKVSLRRTPEEEERKARKKKRRRERRESSQADTTHASREDTTKKMADTEDGTHKDPGGEETVADGGPHDASRGPKLKQTADTVWDEPVFLERVGVWAGPFVLAGD